MGVLSPPHFLEEKSYDSINSGSQIPIVKDLSKGSSEKRHVGVRFRLYGEAQLTPLHSNPAPNCDCPLHLNPYHTVADSSTYNWTDRQTNQSQ